MTEKPRNLEDLVGPFYSSTDLAEWLDTDTDLLANGVRAKALLGMQTGSGDWVYPVWQFMPDRSVLPRLPDVLEALAQGSGDPWTWAAWLCAPSDEISGLSAWQWLAAGENPRRIIQAARRDAARWSR